MPTIVFLDTNVYLHYQDFDQIKWSDVLGIDLVTIVIPPVTVRELYKQKDSNQYTKRIRQRAGKLLNKLYAYFETDLQAIIREGLEVILEDRDPLINFADYNLSRDVNDDHLIASIIMLRDEKPDAQIFLVTSDSGLMLLAKAKRHGIQSVKLSDNFKLKEEPDPDQEKIKELEQELEKLKRTIPNLSLEFEDHNQYKTFTIGSPLEITENEIAVRIAALKLKYPKIEPPEDITKNNNTPLAELLDSVEGRSLLWNTVSSEDIEEYNQELDKFFREYPDSIKRQIAFENQHSRTIKLDIFLANTGTAPGEDIDIFMHFPDGLTLVDELPDSPAELLPPEKPKTLLEKVQGIRVSPAFFGLRSTHFPEFSQPPSNVSPPTIRRTNSYEVEVSVGNIKHGLREQLNPLFVIFDSYDTTTSFQIDYRILAANIPHEIREKLHVVVNKQYTQC